jgi:hypothetical protein
MSGCASMPLHDDAVLHDAAATYDVEPRNLIAVPSTTSADATSYPDGRGPALSVATLLGLSVATSALPPQQDPKFQLVDYRCSGDPSFDSHSGNL